MTPPASEAIPRGWRVDHECPSDFVVRCTVCGRVSIRNRRAQAHKQAQTHALRCSQTGVTPVSRPEATTTVDDAFAESTEESSTLLFEGVTPCRDDLLGIEVVVRYESIQSAAGTQTARGLIDMTIGGESGSFRALELVGEDDRRLRVDVIEETVLCEGRELNSGDVQWRTIGDAELLRPARVGESASGSAVATDGGVR